MKRACLALLILAGAGTLGAVVDPEPDVGDYGFGQVLKNTQTDASTVTQSANPYSFQVFVGGDGSHITNATLAVPGPNAATYNIAGNPDFKFGTSYQYSGTSSSTLLDSVFPRSTGYSMHFETPTNPTGYTVTSLDLTGGVFPSVTPQVTGGGMWSGGTLLVDVTDENNFITLNSFTGMNGTTDLIIFDAWSTTDFHASTSGSHSDGGVFYLGPDHGTHVPYFTIGDTYQASITFLKVVGTPDTGTVPNPGGESGYSFMATRTYFTIQAIPEPSTYALMAGGLALLGIRRLRRSKR
jgi:hypothetical protein